MCKFVTYKQIGIWLMRLKYIILAMMACFALTSTAQPVMNQEDWEWYLGEVVNDVFVGRNYFEYYYTPSAADMEQQRSKGEVTYFLNSPEGLNAKKVRDMIDRLMASYDDINAVCDWQMTNTTYWKEFRFDKNKFRFSVKRKALDDGTYYVSATETAGYYKSLGKSTKGKEKSVKEEPKAKPAVDATPNNSSSTKRSTRSRRTITQQDVDEADKVEMPIVALNEEDTPFVAKDEEDEVTPAVPVISEKERRRAAREREEALAQEQRLAKRRAQEQQREEAKKQKEAEKQKKAEEKKKKEEAKRLAQEKKRQLREQAQQEREQAAERKQTTSRKAVQSKYHYSDIALWLSEKYDFTQTAAGNNSCTMYSSAVKDTEMAKLAIKNALKGSNARMAVPWRINSETQAIETGYIVDNHVLVFTIGKDADEHVTLTVTEVTNDEFEQFKQSLNNF